MTLPNFLVIGAQKAGTSWLWSTLRQNPDVWMPPIKELHFFDHLFVPEVRSWTKWHLVNLVQPAIRWQAKQEHLNYAYIKYLCDIASTEIFTEQWYRNAFSRAPAKVSAVGDITPEYSTISSEGVDYVKSLIPEAKIIYIIRDPVSRALSQVRMAFDRKHIAEPTIGQWKDEIEAHDVAQRGDYRTYVPRWRAAFKENQLLFLPYRRVEGDPARLMEEVERHIGAKPHSYQNLVARIHTTRKRETPPEIKSRLQEKFADQYEFLNANFPAEFVSSL